jgi:hypothetical protein
MKLKLMTMEDLVEYSKTLPSNIKKEWLEAIKNDAKKHLSFFTSEGEPIIIVKKDIINLINDYQIKNDINKEILECFCFDIITNL